MFGLKWQWILLIIIGFAFGGLWVLIYDVSKMGVGCNIITNTTSESSNNNDNDKHVNEYASMSKPSDFPSHYMSNDPVVCVLVRTYSKHRSPLPALIASLGSNDYQNLHVFLIDTVGDFVDMPKFAELYNSLYDRKFVHVSNITNEYANSRFPDFKTPDFGYLQTDLVMEQLSFSDNPFQCTYFVVTNGDNLYSKGLIYFTLDYMRQNIDLIGFHFITHYCYDDVKPFRPREGCYIQHYTEFQLQRIDVGAALIRKQRLIEKDANFIINELKKDPTGSLVQVHFCDGYFYENFAVDTTKIILNATLFIHQ